MLSQAAEQEFDKEYPALPAPGERRVSMVDPVEQEIVALRSLLKENLGDTKFLAVYNAMAAILNVAPHPPCPA